MKTLIEQFATQVSNSTENFSLTDATHMIICTSIRETYFG